MKDQGLQMRCQDGRCVYSEGQQGQAFCAQVMQLERSSLGPILCHYKVCDVFAFITQDKS